ncbi:MAG: hypothetical protein WCL44_08620 [bacterium]
MATTAFRKRVVVELLNESEGDHGQYMPSCTISVMYSIHIVAENATQ